MSKKILIIDDDQYIREIYQELLESESFEVDFAIDGKSGLEKIMATPYDVIILDIMLPQLDGLGILAKINEKKPPHVLGPIVVLTSLSHDPSVRKAMDLGAHSIVIKPEQTPDKIVGLIKSLADGSKVTPEKAAPAQS
jgi:DNA-binding response OmpR family regulator